MVSKNTKIYCSKSSHNPFPSSCVCAPSRVRSWHIQNLTHSAPLHRSCPYPCLPHPRWQNSVPGFGYPKRTWHHPRRHASIMFICLPSTVTFTVCMIGPVVPPIPVHPRVVPIRSTVGSVAATADIRCRHNRWMRRRQARMIGDPAGAAKRC